jgi:hypothetical protein
MAQGTVIMFQEFLGSMGLGEFNLNTDLYKIGLVAAATTPATGDADPGWTGARTTDYSAGESTPGGNYSTGGADITNTYSEAAGVATFDGADQSPYLAQHASNPTDVRWGIIYNDTDADKKAIGYIDMGSTFDATTGDINITWNAGGIFTFTLA